MKILRKLRRLTAGTVLAPTVILSGVLGITAFAMIQLSSYRARAEYGRWSSNEAYRHAENALSWAVQAIADATSGGSSAPFLGQYSLTAGSVSVPYMASLKAEANSDFKEVWVTISNHPTGVTDLYLVTTSAQVGAHTRTVQATVRKNPPSLVFDYEYFLNNWGWWWGSTITGYGDNRANWDFDFRYNPTVNGAIFANGRVACNKVAVDPLTSTPPFKGTAAADPVGMVHSGVPRIPMPNLLDFTYYQNKAVASGSKLLVGSTVVVNAVHADVSKPGLYLKGTAGAPIKINGPVVVPGDVVISGPVTGTGTLYVGGNLYVAGNVTYVNGPSFTTAPSSMSQADRDNWVKNAVADKKDLVGFAVRGSVLGGAVNSSDWKANCFDAADYGLKNVGAEASLGKDGIRSTPDDAVKYLDTNGDGTPDSAWYDADGNGVVNSAYNYAADIQMTATRAGKITGYPKDGTGALQPYDSLSSNNYNRMDGVYYCNHAVANRMAASGVAWNGAVICRDEAIVFNDTLKFVYDPRIHSRYSDDPNRYIDLGLPIANKVRIERVDEIVPVAGFYSGT